MLYIALILLFLKILAWNKACLVMTVSILSTLKDINIVCVNMSKFIPQQETKLQTRRLAFCIFNNSLLCLTKSRNTDSDPVYSPLLGQMWQRFKLGTRPGMTHVGHVCCLKGGGTLQSSLWGGCQEVQPYPLSFWQSRYNFHVPSIEKRYPFNFTFFILS